MSTPIEVAMNSVQMKSNMPSISMFGLSVLKINFEYNVEGFFDRIVTSAFAFTYRNKLLSFGVTMAIVVAGLYSF